MLNVENSTTAFNLQLSTFNFQPIKGHQMKKIILFLAIALAVLCGFSQIDVITVGGTPSVAPEAPAKVVGIRVLSSVASGTVQVKSVSTLPVIEDVETHVAYTNYTYTYTYTNALEQAFTNTTTYLPLPLGPAVTSYVTNSVVTVITNRVPTATSTVVVTNLIGGSITCAGGVGSTSPTNTFIIPNEPLFFEGTARGRVLLIVER